MNSLQKLIEKTEKTRDNCAGFDINPRYILRDQVILKAAKSLTWVKGIDAVSFEPTTNWSFSTPLEALIDAESRGMTNPEIFSTIGEALATVFMAAFKGDE